MTSARAVESGAGPVVAVSRVGPAASRACEFEVVVLGASSGGVMACMTVLQQLPRDSLTAHKRVVVPDMDKFEADPHDIAAYRKSGIMSVQSTPLVARAGASSA